MEHEITDNLFMRVFISILLFVLEFITIPPKNKLIIIYYEKNENLSKFIYRFWDNRKMIKTFPNIKVQDVNGNILYMDNYLDVQPYYMKLITKK